MNLIVIFEYISLQFNEKIFIVLPYKTEKRNEFEIAKEIDNIINKKDLRHIFNTDGKLYGLSKVAII